MSKKKINYVVLFLLIIFTSWLIVANNDFSRLPYLLKKINKIYCAIAIGFMFLYLMVNSVVLMNISEMVHSKLNFRKSFKIIMIGQYYSAITPFSTGGQPAQIYYMTKDNISVGKATSILTIKLIIYQIVVTIYAITMFIFKWDYLVSHVSRALPFVVIGIFINFAGVIIILLLSFNEGIIKNIFGGILKILHKLKLIRNIDKHKNNAEKHLEEYTISIKQLKNHKVMLIKLLLMTFIQLTFYFGITYFIYIALGLKGASIIDIIAMQSLLYMAVSFMPTPGTVGASEGGFHIFFRFLFPKALLIYAMLLWRIISYYLCIILGGLIIMFLHFKESVSDS